MLCAVLVLALGILGVTGFRRRTGDGITRCLLIGCDRFVSMPGTEPASANNVETMAALLKDFLPEGTEITRQVNGPGTAAGFEQLTEETFRDAKAEDTSLIYLSTHGTARGDKMALLLSDGEQEESLEPEVSTTLEEGDEEEPEDPDCTQDALRAALTAMRPALSRMRRW